ncbi:MAG: hypothetical protein Q7K03_03275 [Dehalococcoidia bacterium]|nr:hypothetical protein [Dehalococcoidia bacterium]
MERKDWLLLYLAVPFTEPPQPIDPIRIMKGMFLFAKKAGQPPVETYEFEPYMYGPCSFQIYRDKDELQLQGFLEPLLLPGQTWNLVRITSAGLSRAKQLAQVADKAALLHLETIKRQVMSLSFLDLLRTVYGEFPAYAVNSVVPSP